MKTINPNPMITRYELFELLKGARNVAIRQAVKTHNCTSITLDAINSVFFGMECAVEHSMRPVAVDVDTRPQKAPETGFKVGDVVSFIMGGGEPVKALAVKEIDENMLFIFVDSLKEEYPLMDSVVEYPGWEKSDLRKKLNEEILDRFPEKMRKHMKPFENGDLLRIPTEKEIFGQNKYGMPEPDDVEQFPAMKLKRNRVAFQGYNGDWDWYWLQNRSVDGATAACLVSGYGNATASSASYSHGVRPLFLLSKNPAPEGGEPTVTREWMLGGAGEGTATRETSEGDDE